MYDAIVGTFCVHLCVKEKEYTPFFSGFCLFVLFVCFFVFYLQGQKIIK